MAVCIGYTAGVRSSMYLGQCTIVFTTHVTNYYCRFDGNELVILSDRMVLANLLYLKCNRKVVFIRNVDGYIRVLV